MVRVGSNFKAVGGELFRVARIFRGYGYSANGTTVFTNDTSLLYLSKPIDLKPGVKEAVKMVAAKKTFKIGTRSQVSGWNKETTITDAVVETASEKKCKGASSRYQSGKHVCTQLAPEMGYGAVCCGEFKFYSCFEQF